MVKLMQLQQNLKDDAASFYESLAETERENWDLLTARLGEGQCF